MRHEKALEDTGEGVAAGERRLLAGGMSATLSGTTGRDFEAEGPPASSIRVRVFWTWSGERGVSKVSLCLRG